MLFRSVVKHLVPTPIRRLGWKNYYSARARWLQTIVGCETTQKIAALTFDDGPLPDSTTAILNVLAEHQVKATFFLLGRNVTVHPELAREIVRQGHTVGNHTFNHRRLADCQPADVARELSRCRTAIQNATGVTPRFLRPPFGDQNPASYLIARGLGYAVVNWSVSGDDWNGDSAAVIADRIFSKISPGAIILLHDGWEPDYLDIEPRPEHARLRERGPTIEALAIVLAQLQGEGYKFVTVPDMIRTEHARKQAWFVQD